MAKRYQSKKRGCAAPFLLFLFALIFGGLFLYWSNNTILVHEETISSPQLPAAFDGLRIYAFFSSFIIFFHVFVSDF